MLLVVYCKLFFHINASKRDTAVERLVVEDIAQRKRIISSIHDTSHLGVKWTQDMVAGKYYRHHLLNLNGIVANAFSWVTFCTIVYFL